MRAAVDAGPLGLDGPGAVLLPAARRDLERQHPAGADRLHAGVLQQVGGVARGRRGRLHGRRDVRHAHDVADRPHLDRLRREPVQERVQVGRRHRVEAAARADVVEHDRHPAAPVVQGVEHLSLEVGHRRLDVDRLEGAHGPAVARRDGLRAGLPAVAADVQLPAGAPAREAAGGDRLLRRSGVARVRVGVARDLEALVEQPVAVVAELAALLVDIVRGQVDVVDAVRADLVAGVRRSCAAARGSGSRHRRWRRC